MKMTSLPALLAVLLATSSSGTGGTAEAWSTSSGSVQREGTAHSLPPSLTTRYLKGGPPAKSSNGNGNGNGPNGSDTTPDTTPDAANDTTTYEYVEGSISEEGEQFVYVSPDDLAAAEAEAEAAAMKEMQIVEQSEAELMGEEEEMTGMEGNSGMGSGMGNGMGMGMGNMDDYPKESGVIEVFDPYAYDSPGTGAPVTTDGDEDPGTPAGSGGGVSEGGGAEGGETTGDGDAPPPFDADEDDGEPTPECDSMCEQELANQALMDQYLMEEEALAAFESDDEGTYTEMQAQEALAEACHKNPKANCGGIDTGAYLEEHGGVGGTTDPMAESEAPQVGGGGGGGPGNNSGNKPNKPTTIDLNDEEAILNATMTPEHFVVPPEVQAELFDNPEGSETVPQPQDDDPVPGQVVKDLKKAAKEAEAAAAASGGGGGGGGGKNEKVKMGLSSGLAVGQSKDDAVDDTAAGSDGEVPPPPEGTDEPGNSGGQGGKPGTGGGKPGKPTSPTGGGGGEGAATTDADAGGGPGNSGGQGGGKPGGKPTSPTGGGGGEGTDADSGAPSGPAGADDEDAKTPAGQMKKGKHKVVAAILTSDEADAAEDASVGSAATYGEAEGGDEGGAAAADEEAGTAGEYASAEEEPPEEEEGVGTTTGGAATTPAEEEEEEATTPGNGNGNGPAAGEDKGKGKPASNK